MRDEFPKTVVETLSKRVANRCSNPDCRRPTCGPHSEVEKALNVGVAAHITAASHGGPRFDHSLTSEERSGIDNGIWLCQCCGKLVDNDESRYGKDVLIRWKHGAEREALRQVEAAGRSSDLYFENADISGGNGRVGPGGNVNIKGANGGGGLRIIGASIKGGDGGDGGGKGGDVTVEGGDGV